MTNVQAWGLGLGLGLVNYLLWTIFRELFIVGSFVCERFVIDPFRLL